MQQYGDFLYFHTIITIVSYRIVLLITTTKTWRIKSIYFRAYDTIAYTDMIRVQ